MTPPFKPVVESDESVANFDPEFTSADVREAGLAEMDLDEEDPSPNWVALSSSVNGTIHTPNGPLGSDRPGSGDRPGPAPVQGIEIAKGKKKRDHDPPLTNSVQENFRGFTYHGESIVAPAAGVLADGGAEPDAEAVDEEPEPTTDDEVESDSPAGRYAKSRRRQGDAFDGFDDDMHL